MLKFMRNKLVTVSRGAPGMLEVHGVLDDDIYGLELDVTFREADLEITAIRGWWNRHTTPECPRAVAPLQEAVGFRVLDEGFSAKVHKVVGRKACRHFANLLLECSHAAKEAMWVEGWKRAREAKPRLELEEFVRNLPPPGPAKPVEAAAAPPPPPPPSTHPDPGPEVPAERPPGGTLIDLHTHSLPASPCSSASVDDLIREARQCGLDAVCLTDHNHVWSEEEVAALREKHDFPVLRGNEITTSQGDILVFGFHRDVQGIIELEDLRAEVLEAGGYMIAAHPFRGFLVVGVGQLGMTPQQSAERPMFRQVDALEVLNGKVTPRENAFAAEVAERLGLPRTGGSDAHEASEVGRYATHFPGRIRSEEDLVRALHKGGFTPVVFRRKQALSG